MEYELSPQAKQMKAGAQAASGLSSGAVIGVSILNLSSIAAIWSLVNQFQLFLLLLLTKTPFPDDVKGLILGNELMSFDLGSIPIRSLPQINWTLNFVDFEQDNVYLQTVGIESQGGIANNINFALSIIMFL